MTLKSDAAYSSVYSVDGRRMDYGPYRAQLELIGLWVEAKTFLVFQGDVESIASKSPKELTELFEKISGSGALRRAYDEAKEDVEAKEEAFTQSFEHKRFVIKERHQLKQQKEEADKYITIAEQFKASKINLTLFQLFHLQNDIDKKTGEAKAQAKVGH